MRACGDNDDAASTFQSLNGIIFVYGHCTCSDLVPVSRGSTQTKPGRYWLARATRLRRNLKRRPPTLQRFYFIFGGTPPTAPSLTSVLPASPLSLFPRSSHHPLPSLALTLHNKVDCPLHLYNTPFTAQAKPDEVRQRPPTSAFYFIFGGTPPTSPPLTTLLPTSPPCLVPRSSHHPLPSLTPTPRKKR